jgi:hypothetical protein
MREVMTTCVINDNMIVQEEQDDNIYEDDWEFEGELVEPQHEAIPREYFLHCIICCGIAPLMAAFKPIWLSICGFVWKQPG